MYLTAGALLQGYALVEQVGEGGQGVVWKAHRLGDPTSLVALKLVRGGHHRRVMTEMQTLRHLDHSSVVRCHDMMHDDATESLVLVLEWIEGTALSAAVGDARFGKQQRRLVIKHLAHALSYLHGRRVVHRDIKPQNVILTNGFWSSPVDPGTVKLVDFGIALEVDSRRVTEPGRNVASLAYAPPELFGVVGGDGDASPTRDVFAFGLLCYEVLTGRRALDVAAASAKTRQEAWVWYRDAWQEAASGKRLWPPSDRTCADEPWLAQCLALDPARRPRDGGRIVDLIEGIPVSSATMRAVIPASPLPTETLPEPSTVQARTRRGAMLTAIGLVCAALATTLFFLMRPSRPPAQAMSFGPLPRPALPAPPPEPPCPASCCAGDRCAPNAMNSSAAFVQFTGCDSSKDTCPPCASGRRCVPGPCNLPLDPAARWSLRVGRLLNSPGSRPTGEPKVCMRLAGQADSAWACAVREADGTWHGSTLVVATDQLRAPGIDIRVFRSAQDKVYVSSAAKAIKGRGVARTALCDGLWYRLSGAVYAQLVIHLDDAPKRTPP